MQHLRQLTHIIEDRIHGETGEGTPWGLGTYQRERIFTVAEYCAEMWSGDLLEIGCYTGSTTQLLAEVARKHKRRVMAVDPWADDAWIYDKFMENTEGFHDLLDIVRLPSQKAIEQIGARALCFAFVDGLHTHEGLLSDIMAVAHCKGIIAVDDVSYECEPENLRPACWEGARRLDRQLYWHNKCREAYLLL